jgi:hypothetical protein
MVGAVADGHGRAAGPVRDAIERDAHRRFAKPHAARQGAGRPPPPAPSGHLGGEKADGADPHAGGLEEWAALVSLAHDPAGIHVGHRAGGDHVERLVEGDRDAEPARHVVEAAQREDAEGGVLPEHGGCRPRDGAVPTGDDDIVAGPGRVGRQLAGVVLLRELAMADLEPAGLKGAPQRIGAQERRILGQGRAGARLAAGDRVHEQQDRPSRHSIPRW